MNDQACELRKLVLHRPPAASGHGLHRSRLVLLTAGKGGAGTTTIALNLAVALAGHAYRAVLVDADPRGGVERLCRLRRRATLTDVLAGRRSIAEILQPGPGGIQIAPGDGGLDAPGELAPGGPQRLLAQLSMLDAQADVVVIDGGSGLSRLLTQCAAGCDTVLVVTTPEPASVMNSYALIKILAGQGRGAVPQYLVNFAPTAAAAENVQARMDRACRRFLAVQARACGQVPFDPAVAAAAEAAAPLVLTTPSSPAARHIDRLAQIVISGRDELIPFTTRRSATAIIAEKH